MVVQQRCWLVNYRRTCLGMAGFSATAVRCETVEKLEDAPKSARMIDFSQLAAEEISEEGRAQLQLQSQEVGTFGSLHPWQVNFLFADGSVRALSKKIDPALFSSLISRADGSPLSDEGF